MPKPTASERDEADAYPQTCPICLEAITRRAAIYLSRCQPVPHAMHIRCWKRQTHSQRKKCCVCRQNIVDDLTLAAVAELCNVHRQRPTVADLTPHFICPTGASGKGLLRSFQLGVISRRELWSYILWMRHDGDRPSDDVMGRLCI